MFNKILILIGLKQEEPLESKDENSIIYDAKVIPSTESRFDTDENNSDVKIHSTDDDVEIKALRSWKEIESLGELIKNFNIVCMDIRDISDKNERQRVIDFISGMVHVMDSKLRIINQEGVYLIRKQGASLAGTQRTRLETMGLYKV